MKRIEQTIQKAVIQHLRRRKVDGVIFWHTDNNVGVSGPRGAVQGAIKKSLGVRAGVSDILAFHRSKLFCLELKAPGGRPTEEQLKFIGEVKSQGGFGVVAEGLDEAIRALEFWGLVKGEAA